MSKVTIWDMDFFYKKSFKPHPIAMKLSSYHKQQQDIVNFVTKRDHINISFDIYYIIREKKTTPKPPGILRDDDRVKLIGKEMRFYDNHWEPSPIISAVRPDYLLYPQKEKDAYYNANIAQFYHNGKLLTKKQPFENSHAHHKKTLVIDKEFWDVSDKSILICLEELKEYKNIAFLHPIRIQRIVQSKKIMESFLELHFSQGTIFKFRNDYGQSLEEAREIFKFISKLKELNPNKSLGRIPFKAVTTDHWESTDNGIYDLKRAIMIMNEAKKSKVNIRIVSPRNRFDCPFWYYFEMLEFWTLYLERVSYIELMLNSAIKKFKIPWYEILNNKLKWNLPNTRFLLSLIYEMPEFVKEFGTRQWGEKFIDTDLINWKTVLSFKRPITEEKEKLLERL